MITTLVTSDSSKIWEFGEIIELLKKDVLSVLLGTVQSLEFYKCKPEIREALLKPHRVKASAPHVDIGDFQNSFL